MRIIINNIPYRVDEGAIYTMNYNETLDSATIRLSHLTQELDIEPFDKVILETEAFTRYLCIDSYTTIQEGLDTPTYVYNINLVSQTKLLENIVLPNISITPRKIGDKLSIAYYLKQYLSEYASHTEWHFDEDKLDAKFGDYCPELQWNMPTLREVFNTLMMVKDCIPILENNLISWLDLTKKKGEVSGDINYIQKSQSADDYVSEIRMQLQNVMQTNVEGVDNTCDTYENMTFTTDDYVATTDNIYLKTKFPILNIKHLWLTCYYCNEYENPQIFKIDLCDIDEDGYGIVYEKNEYDVLPVLYRTLDITDNRTFNQNTVKDYFSKYKNYCVYFNRGDTGIYGFSEVQKGSILSFTIQKLQWIKALAFSRAVRGEGTYVYNTINNGYLFTGTTTVDTNAFFNAFFQIEYETTVAATFSASKETKVKNERIIIDNQTNSWVEAYNQGFFEYQKANRMGNQQLLINQRSKYPAYQETFADIGQTYKDSIIYRIQWQFFRHHVEVNAYATKNYILQNYFTGIKSKIRTWVNARNEAFIRSDLIKKYCVFSLENISSSALSNYLLSPFKNAIISQILPIKYAIIKTNETNNNKYLFDIICRVVGKSLVFTTGFNDNWLIQKHVNIGTHTGGLESYQDGIIANNEDDIKAGSYFAEGVKKSTCPPTIKGSLVSSIGFIDPCVNKSFGGIPFNIYKYVNDDGEYESVDIELIDEFNSVHYTNFRTALYNSYAKPLVMSNESYNTQITEHIELHKDNKEIPMFNLQYEFISDNDNIVVTEYYARYQLAIRSKEMQPLQFYYSNKTLFNRSVRNMNDFGDRPYTRINNASIDINNNQVTINANRPNNTILYICDGNKNIILMLNMNPVDNQNVIYLNVLDRRN